jgi:hypothetical protein
MGAVLTRIWQPLLLSSILTAFGLTPLLQSRSAARNHALSELIKIYPEWVLGYSESLTTMTIEFKDHGRCDWQVQVKRGPKLTITGHYRVDVMQDTQGSYQVVELLGNRKSAHLVGLNREEIRQNIVRFGYALEAEFMLINQPSPTFFLTDMVSTVLVPKKLASKAMPALRKEFKDRGTPISAG